MRCGVVPTQLLLYLLAMKKCAHAKIVPDRHTCGISNLVGRRIGSTEMTYGGMRVITGVVCWDRLCVAGYITHDGPLLCCVNSDARSTSEENIHERETGVGLMPLLRESFLWTDNIIHSRIADYTSAIDRGAVSVCCAKPQPAV